MHAPKCASCPSSGKVHLDTKFYAPVLTDLFDHYNLLGDGIISPEVFTSTQQLIKSIISRRGLESPKTSASPKLSGGGQGTAIPSRASATNASRRHSVPHSRQQRPASGVLPATGGQVVGIQASGLAKTRTPSPPPHLSKQTLQFSVVGSESAPSRSPSLVLYGNDDGECGVIRDFESFLSWQHRLLGASSKNSTEKMQRLAWLVGELDKLSTAQVKSRFWKKRHQSLIKLESEFKKSCKLEASGEIASAVHGLELALYDMQNMMEEERIAAGSGKALAAIEFEKQRKYLRALKQKLSEKYIAELSEDGLTCAAYKAKLRQALEIMSKEELAPQVQRFKQMQKCFKLHIATLSGSEVVLDVSRLEAVAQIKEKLGAELDVWAYRLNLSSEAGEALVDNKTLEDYGIIGVGSTLFVVVGARQLWREMSHKDFLELLVSKRLETRFNLTQILKVDPAPPDFDEVAFRQRYMSRLEEIEKKEELQRQRKEQQEQKRQSIIAQAQRLRDKLGDASAAAEMASLVSAAEAESSEQVRKCCAMKEDAQRDLDEALPALDAAIRALHTLDKKDICEIKAFCRPPQAVVIVLEAVCILLGHKPTWDSAKLLMSDPRFLDMLVHYDKDNIPAVVTRKLRHYIDSDHLVPDRVRMASQAAAAMCMWVRAMYTYDRISKIIEPKRHAIRDAEEQVEDLHLGVHCWQECLVSARAAANPDREGNNDFQGAVSS